MERNMWQIKETTPQIIIFLSSGDDNPFFRKATKETKISKEKSDSGVILISVFFSKLLDPRSKAIIKGREIAPI